VFTFWIQNVSETRGKLIMCLRSGSRMFTFWIQKHSVAPSSHRHFSTPTSFRPRHFDSHSHLFLAIFGSGNAELRTIQNQKKQVSCIDVLLPPLSVRRQHRFVHRHFRRHQPRRRVGRVYIIVPPSSQSHPPSFQPLLLASR